MYAKRAGVRAAIDHRHMRADQSTALRQRQGEFAYLGRMAARDSRALSVQVIPVGDAIQQRGRVRRRQEDIHLRESAREFRVAFYPYQAAHQPDHKAGVVAILQAPHALQPTIGPILGALPHNASVQHGHIGLADFICRRAAKFLQLGSQPQTVGHIHLTANRMDVVFHGTQIIPEGILPTRATAVNGRPAAQQ